MGGPRHLFRRKVRLVGCWIRSKAWNEKLSNYCPGEMSSLLVLSLLYPAAVEASGMVDKAYLAKGTVQ